MGQRVIDPPQVAPDEQGTRPGGWWHQKDDKVVCDLCPRACVLGEGQRGFCFVRQNLGGQMVLTTYGRSTGFCIDPIEKKPLNHFFPGSAVLSFGTAGCNLGCKFCQNWSISKSREIRQLSERASPQAIAGATRSLGCQSVAYTYNDPIIFAEYAIDTAKACREAGILNVAVTSGYISHAARPAFFRFMDAANVDLKGFTEDFYWNLCSGHLQPVLDTLRYLVHETDVWVEITTLLIPRANDSSEELRRMCDWITEHLGTDVPLHFTAFHPDFRLQDRGPTPIQTLNTAYDIACQTGLKYVYTGNCYDVARQSTYCPACHRCVIEREGYTIGRYFLKGNHCAHCGAEVHGRFDAAGQPGQWGSRRQPVPIAMFEQRMNRKA